MALRRPTPPDLSLSSASPESPDAPPRTRESYFTSYATHVPLPLAIERSMECRILSDRAFPRPVLDVGCGEGIFAANLFVDPIDAGLDPNERELQLARGLGAYRALIQAFGGHIPQPDATYGSSFANSVLEHIAELPPVLQEVYRVLRPGGLFYATVPTDSFPANSIPDRILTKLGLKRATDKWRRFYRWFWRLYNVHPVDDWLSLFREAGFDVEEHFTYQSRRLYLVRELLMVFSFPGWILKQVLNRWIFIPYRVRALLLKPVIPILDRILSEPLPHDDGTLLFVQLRKPLEDEAVGY